VARRVTTIAELAKGAGLDEDEALIRLWDAGLEKYADPADRIRRRDLQPALRALELPTRRDLTQPEYWCRQLGITRPELGQLLAELGSPMSRNAQTVPRGAVAKLRRRGRQSLAVEQVEETPRATPEPKFEWRVQGHKRELRLLTQAEVEAIHIELARDFERDADPIDPPGVRSAWLLGSAVFRQHTAMGGQSKYPTIEMAAAALLHAVVHDHPFHNGNKRTGLVAMLVLLDENGFMLICDEDDLFRMVVRLAQHKVVPPGRDLPDREMSYLAEWICERSRGVDKSARPVQWRRLRQILRAFDCEVEIANGKVNVERRLLEKARLGRTRARLVRTQVKYTDDGREATVQTIGKIRRDLELDDDHGVDSEQFYNRAGLVASAFIVKYRKTLKRLARL
jgi:death-on-curing family protein